MLLETQNKKDIIYKIPLVLRNLIIILLFGGVRFSSFYSSCFSSPNIHIYIYIYFAATRDDEFDIDR